MAKRTMVQIAKAARVSKSTVSRVINNSGYVSKEARKKIEEAILEDGYFPSAAARTLSKQESNIVGVLLPDPTSYFFSQILQGISEITDKNNVVLIFCNTDDSVSKELRALQMLAEHRAKGVIMTPVVETYDKKSEQALRNAVKRLDAPVVFVDRKIDRISRDAVLFDNYNGAYMAAEALIHANFKQIGAICADKSLRLGRERLNGFLQALTDHDLKPPPDSFLTYDACPSSEELYKDSAQMIAKMPRNSAAFLSNGVISKAFLKAVFDKGLSLGKDITCVGFDKLEISEIFHKLPFNYVARSEVEMGRIAAKMLFERLESDSETHKEYVIPAIMHTDYLPCP